MLTATVNGVELPASSFLYVPDPEKPSTWKLPVKSASGSPDPGRIAAAAAALSPGGFRGKQVDLPEEDRLAAKKKLIALYKEIGRGDNIPPHLEGKSLATEGADSFSFTGTLRSVQDYEYKNQRGLRVETVINSLLPDLYKDWAILTEELKSSTDDYFSKGSNVLIEHGRGYDGKTPVRFVMGSTIEHFYDEAGIHAVDFIPEPTAHYPPEAKRAYEELKSGYFTATSVAGNFFRDTGLHKPPGIIYDWELYEHSYCRHPVDTSAHITNISEVKSILDECQTACQLPQITLTPISTPIQAEAKTAPQGDSPQMEDKEVQGRAATPPADDIVANLVARLTALEAEKKTQEAQADAARRDKEARETAEATARQIALDEAQRDAEQKALIEQYTAEALSKYQIAPIAQRLTVPNVNYNRSGGNPIPAGTRYTMAGIVPEAKSRIDDKGNLLPEGIVSWLMEVKSGQRQAVNRAWDSRFSGGGELKTVATGVPGAATFSPAGTAGGFALPPQYLADIVPLLTDPASIRSMISVYPASSILLQVPKMAIAPTRAVVTAENALKPKTDIGTTMISVQLYQVPRIIDIPNQLLDFSRDTAEQTLREHMVAALRLAEFYYAIQGTGTGEPYGLLPALAANNIATPSQFFVISQASGNDPNGVPVSPTETLPDFIARGMNVTQIRYYQPDVLLVHPNIWWKLITQKDLQGRYLVDANMTAGVNSVWGIRVMHTTQIPVGKGIIGEWKKLRMYVAGDISIDMTREAGERFDRNQTGFRIEELIGINAEQELNAFTELDFDLSL